jgi:hypothetical protein
MYREWHTQKEYEASGQATLDQFEEEQIRKYLKICDKEIVRHFWRLLVSK